MVFLADDGDLLCDSEAAGSADDVSEVCDAYWHECKGSTMAGDDQVADQSSGWFCYTQVMTDAKTTDMSDVVVGNEQVIGSDFACVECGYNLRTMKHSGDCPECGTAVVESLRGDLLEYADSRWLGRIHWGVRLFMVWYLLEISHWPVVMLMRYLTRVEYGDPDSAWFMSGILADLFLLFGVGVFGSMGYLLTSYEPRKYYRSRSVWYWVVRLAVIVFVVSWIGEVIIDWWYWYIDPPEMHWLLEQTLLEWVDWSIGLIHDVATIIAMIGCTVLLHRLSKRMIDRRLLGQTILMMFIAGIVTWMYMPYSTLIKQVGLDFFFSRFDHYKGWVSLYVNIYFLLIGVGFVSLIGRLRNRNYRHEHVSILEPDDNWGDSKHIAGMSKGLSILKWSFFLVLGCVISYSSKERYWRPPELFAAIDSVGLLLGLLGLYGGSYMIFRRPGFSPKMSFRLAITATIVWAMGSIGLFLMTVNYLQVVAIKRGLGLSHDEIWFEMRDCDLSGGTLIIVSLFVLLNHLGWMAGQIGHLRLAGRFRFLNIAWFIYVICFLLYFLEVTSLPDEHPYPLSFSLLRRIFNGGALGLSVWTLVLVDLLWREFDRGVLVVKSRG